MMKSLGTLFLTKWEALWRKFYKMDSSISGRIYAIMSCFFVAPAGMVPFSRWRSVSSLYIRIHSVSERVTTAFLMYSSGSAARVSIHFVHISFIVMVNVDVLSSFFVYVVVQSMTDIYNDKRKLSDHKSAKYKI